jgi:hypothetical protein
MSSRLNFNRSFAITLLAFVALILFSLNLFARSRLASTALFLGVSSSDAPSDEATITYRKVFKSSYPEFTEIKVSQSGAATYDIRQMTDSPAPQAAQISASLVARIFGLASKLHDFDGVDIEMHHRIANLGLKTFTYQRGAETHSVSFNYTLNEPASQLYSIFDDLARQQTDLSDLMRTMRYDRLGVNDVLQQVQKDYDNHLFLQPDQFLPALDQLASDTHFIDIAREHARTLAARIRASR